MSRRRVPLVVFGVAAGLLLFELALQAVALVVWLAGRHEAPAAAGEVVLCVGDSFTYGLGATGAAGSYPRQLEALLRAGGEPAVVVNGGWPGLTSREVLLRLPGQLRRHRPRRVVILVGTNDPWRRPPPVCAAELAAGGDARPGFPLQLRTARLVQLVASWLRRGGPAAAPPAFVGVWHEGTTEVVFEASGRLRLGKDELRWTERGGGLSVLMPDGTEQPVVWDLLDGRLHLRGPGFENWLERGPAPPPGPVARAVAAAAAGDPAAARTLLGQAIAAGDGVDAALAELVRVELAAGDRTAAAAAAQRLGRRFAELRTAAAGSAWLGGLVELGDRAEALAAAGEVLAAHPGDLDVWRVLLTPPLIDQERPAVLRLMSDVLAAAAGDEAWRPALLQMHAGLQVEHDPAAALGALLLAFLQDGDRGFLLRQLEMHRDRFDAAVRAAAVAALPVTAGDRRRAQAVLDGEAAGDGAGGGEVQQVLAGHLRRMVELARAAGASVLLLTYPAADPALEAVVADVARAQAVPVLALHPAFDELLQTTSRAALFIADGHCTDRGYGVIAAQVAAALRR